MTQKNVYLSARSLGITLDYTADSISKHIANVEQK